MVSSLKTVICVTVWHGLGIFRQFDNFWIRFQMVYKCVGGGSFRFPFFPCPEIFRHDENTEHGQISDSCLSGNDSDVSFQMFEKFFQRWQLLYKILRTKYYYKNAPLKICNNYYARKTPKNRLQVDKQFGYFDWIIWFN